MDDSNLSELFSAKVNLGGGGGGGGGMPLTVKVLPSPPSKKAGRARQKGGALIKASKFQPMQDQEEGSKKVGFVIFSSSSKKKPIHRLVYVEAGGGRYYNFKKKKWKEDDMEWPPNVNYKAFTAKQKKNPGHFCPPKCKHCETVERAQKSAITREINKMMKARTAKEKRKENDAKKRGRKRAAKFRDRRRKKRDKVKEQEIKSAARGKEAEGEMGDLRALFAGLGGRGQFSHGTLGFNRKSSRRRRKSSRRRRKSSRRRRKSSRRPRKSSRRRRKSSRRRRKSSRRRRKSSRRPRKSSRRRRKSSRRRRKSSRRRRRRKKSSRRRGRPRKSSRHKFSTKFGQPKLIGGGRGGVGRHLQSSKVKSGDRIDKRNAARKKWIGSTPYGAMYAAKTNAQITASTPELSEQEGREIQRKRQGAAQHQAREWDEIMKWQGEDLRQHLGK